MSGGALPVVLVILDGLGDRALPELGGRTPAEAAHLPNLARLAARGASGVHLPFGPGAAPSSELAHWSLLGYDRWPFCGRSVLEALGAGLDVPEGVMHFQASLRTSRVVNGAVWITGRADRTDRDDAHQLLVALGAGRRGQFGLGLGFTFDLLPLPVGPAGDAVLRMAGPAVAHVTDSDPFFSDRHPWLRPLAYADAEDHPAAERTADALRVYLLRARALLRRHPVNAARAERGLEPLDVLTTKWAGVRQLLPSFTERAGTTGATVASTGLYRGLAELLGLRSVRVDPAPDLAEDMTRRLAAAAALLREGVGFVHVHTKVTDEAGHTKDPRRKLEVLEALDPAFAALSEPPFRDAVVAVTGDHATPSRDPVLHSGDPTPFVVAAPTLRPDPVAAFGEEPAAAGALGRLRAAEVLPLLLGAANRAAFMGHRCTAWPCLGLPDHPEAMPADGDAP